MAEAISLLLLAHRGRLLQLGVFRVFPMRSGVVLCRFFGMVFGLNMMAVRQMGMVGGFLVIALLMVLGGVFMMFRSVFMVLRGVAMMIDVFLRHGKSSLKEIVKSPGLYSAISIGAANYRKIAGKLQRYLAHKQAAWRRCCQSACFSHQVSSRGARWIPARASPRAEEYLKTVRRARRPSATK
jgi:hypothetical protein